MGDVVEGLADAWVGAPHVCGSSYSLLCTWIRGMNSGGWGVSRRWESCEPVLDGGRGRLVASSGD